MLANPEVEIVGRVIPFAVIAPIPQQGLGGGRQVGGTSEQGWHTLGDGVHHLPTGVASCNRLAVGTKQLGKTAVPTFREFAAQVGQQLTRLLWKGLTVFLEAGLPFILPACAPLFSLPKMAQGRIGYGEGVGERPAQLLPGKYYFI